MRMRINVNGKQCLPRRVFANISLVLPLGKAYISHNGVNPESPCIVNSNPVAG